MRETARVAPPLLVGIDSRIGTLSLSDRRRELPLREAKAALRAQMRALRRARGPRERTSAGEAVAHRLAALLDELPQGAVALFHALAEEIDTEPAMQAVRARGRQLLLPRQNGRKGALSFHLFNPGDPLTRGPFGVFEPLANAPVAEPAVVVVPLLAFDRRGGRLGYGAGFYDRTVAGWRKRGLEPALVGLAFAFQEVESVPTGPHDLRLAHIITEQETITCSMVRSG